MLVAWKTDKKISDDLRRVLVVFWIKGAPIDPSGSPDSTLRTFVIWNRVLTMTLYKVMVPVAVLHRIDHNKVMVALIVLHGIQQNTL